MRKFLCGCDLPSNDALQGDPELKTLAVCSYDEEGLLVCKIHHQRRYGWASLPIVQTPNGKRADFSFASLTPWQIEQVVLFGVDKEYLISKNTLGLRIHFFPDDRRDNRDPEFVAEEHMVKRYGAMQRLNGGFAEVRGLSDLNFRPREVLDFSRNPEAGRALLKYHRAIATLDDPVGSALKNTLVRKQADDRERDLM